ncbi:MAG: DUF1573 domain-containing protein [Acidobacteriia bacterium]|nr:DUF1573 domain-containing protein [Terriglobia bacterium]
MKRLLPIIFLALGAPGLLPLAARQKSPIIEFDSTTREVGKVIDGEAINQVFKFANKGDATLEILSVEPSCGCTSAGAVPRKLAPGQSGQIEIKIATEGLAALSKTAAETVALSKTVTVISNDPKQPQTVLTINITVAPEIAVSDPSIYFGSNPRGREVTKELLVEIAPDRAVKLLSAASTDENITVKLEPVPGSDGKKYKVIAVQKSNGEDGMHVGNIVIKTSSRLKPEVRVAVRYLVIKGN